MCMQHPYACTTSEVAGLQIVVEIDLAAAVRNKLVLGGFSLLEPLHSSKVGQHGCCEGNISTLAGDSLEATLSIDLGIECISLI